MNTIIKGAGFHHIALRVTDFDRTIEFYKALGFALKCFWGEDNERIAMMDMGDGSILEVFAGGTDEEHEGRFFHLAIKAENVEYAYNTAINAGATSKAEPCIIDVAQANPTPLKLNIAFVYGPSKEVIEFFKEL